MVYNEIKKVLFDKQTIQDKVAEIGAQITKDYCGQKPLIVCISTQTSSLILLPHQAMATAR